MRIRWSCGRSPSESESSRILKFIDSSVQPVVKLLTGRLRRRFNIFDANAAGGKKIAEWGAASRYFRGDTDGQMAKWWCKGGSLGRAPVVFSADPCFSIR